MSSRPPSIAASEAYSFDNRQGHEQRVAVLFADLRGFTRMAEKKLPYDTVFILNRYFEAVDRVRNAHRAAWKEQEGFSLTYLPFIARAVVDAMEDSIPLWSQRVDDFPREDAAVEVRVVGSVAVLNVYDDGVGGAAGAAERTGGLRYCCFFFAKSFLLSSSS